MERYNKVDLTGLCSIDVNKVESISQKYEYVGKVKKKIFGFIPITLDRGIKNIVENYYLDNYYSYIPDKPFEFEGSYFKYKSTDSRTSNGGFPLYECMFVRVHRYIRGVGNYREKYIFDNLKDMEEFLNIVKKSLPKDFIFMDNNTGKVIDTYEKF